MRSFAALLLVGGCGFSLSLGTSDASETDDDAPIADGGRGHIVPSNGLDPAWIDESATTFAPTTNGTIDTDTGTITGLGGLAFHTMPAVDCGGGAMIGIGVFAFAAVTIPAGIRMRVVGSRALAIVAAGPIHIDGVIDASSGLECGVNAPRCAGPGGFMGGNFDAFAPERGGGPSGGRPGYSANGPGDESGGGGGGACAAGGKGGDAGPSYLGGSGGEASMPAALVPLCGGSGGGAGGPASFAGDPGARGGGGGGAIQIVSNTEIAFGGALGGITVAGAGGQGDKAQTIDDGAGGGGAGGAILLEAPTITLAAGAVLVANGGGGGGGYNNTLVATDGSESTIASTSAAAGGPGVRRGGNGGAGTTNAGEAAPGPVGDGGAGGGGATGRIRLNTRSASASLAGVVSPAIGTCTTQGTIATR